MTEPGWFADPTGRFGRRWYDGSAWTQHVVGAGGDVLADDLPHSDTPFAPPPPAAPVPSAAPVPAAAPQPPPGGYPTAHGDPAASPQVRYGVGAGLIIGLVGMVLVALGLFAIPWTSADKSRFTDLSSQLHKLHPSSFPNIGTHLYYVYGSWLAYVLFAAVLVLTVLAGIPVPHTGVGNRIWRIVASLLAGLAGVLHSMTLVYVFTDSGHDAGFGALSALVGYLFVLVAMIFGARRIVRPPARRY